MKSKHLASNCIMVALAGFTLFFAAVSPPWTEASAAEAKSSHSISYNATDEFLADPPGSYTLLRPYVESRGGKVVYNPENHTIDIKMNDGSFSLLLEDNIIRCDGRELPGRFYIQESRTYMDSAWIDELTECRL